MTNHQQPPIPPDTLQRMAAVVIAVQHWRKAENFFEEIENQSQVEDFFHALTPEDLQHIERLAKGDRQ